MQQITSWILAHPLGATHLSPAAAVVALHVAQALERSGRCRLTVSQLASRAGLSARHVQRVLAQILAHPESPIVREQEHCLAMPWFAMRGAGRVAGGDMDVTQHKDSLSSIPVKDRESLLGSSSDTPGAPPAIAVALPPKVEAEPRTRTVPVDLPVVVQAYEQRLGRTPTPGEIDRAKGPLVMLLAADPELIVEDVAAGILATTDEQMRGGDGRLWDDLPSLLRFPDRFRVHRVRRQLAQDEQAREEAHYLEQERFVRSSGSAEQIAALDAAPPDERKGLLACWWVERMHRLATAERAREEGVLARRQAVDDPAPEGQPEAEADLQARRRSIAAGLAACRAAVGLSC